jgi:PAS domain S-box-containing protein
MSVGDNEATPPAWPGANRPPASFDFDRLGLAELFEQAPGFMAVVSGDDHRFQLANPRYEKLIGGRSLLGRTVAEALPDAAEQGYVALLDRVLDTGTAYTATAALYSARVEPGGPVEDHYVDFVLQPIRKDGGRPIGIFMQGFDVTSRVLEQRRRDCLVRLSDQFARGGSVGDFSFAAGEVLGDALGASRVGFGTIDDATDTLFVERDWTAEGVDTLAGATPLRHYGSFIDSLKIGEFISIGDVRLDPRTAQAAAALEGRSARSFVNVPVLENGRLVAVVFVNSNRARRWVPEELAFVKEVADRTRTAIERTRSEDALRASEARLRELNETLEDRVSSALAERKVFSDVIEGSKAAVTALDLNFRILAINRANVDAFERAFGKRPRVGDNFFQLFHDLPAHVEQQRGIWTRALAGEEFSIVEAFGAPSFERRYYEVRFSSLRNTDGQMIGASSTSYDVTERVQAEQQLASAQEQLRQSQKMEAMGQLTGGVAHDFNNLLTPIIGSLDMLVRRQVGTERERRLIDGALQSAERAKTLVQRLLAFARRQPLQVVALNLAQLISNIANLIDSTSGPHVEVRVDLDTDLPPVVADPNQLEMAILNLAVNARDAMPNGGLLNILAKRAVIDSEQATSLRPGVYVRLSVTDTGFGMDDHTLARAIEPFFSTKGIGKGTGLGLSMVHGLAAQLGGELTIKSSLGEGTMVSLLLPASSTKAVTGSSASYQSLARANLGKALLVDDEEMVRMTTADMLVDLGYEVIEARSGDEGLRLLQSGLEIELLVTDHLMPGLNGEELARQVRSLHPELPILIISGYAEEDGLTPELDRLTKPFRKAELAEKLVALGTLVKP